MYTKEYDEEAGNWVILDAEGDRLGGAVFDEEDADIFLSHLNR